MIRVIDQARKLRHRDTWDKLARFRHDIFVKECGWKDFDVDGEREADPYDDENAVYAVSLTTEDRVVGCFRLFPTTEPHMLNEAFAYLVEGSVPQQSDIIELTRLAVARDKRDGRVYQEIFAGLQEIGLQEGYVGATAVIRAHRVPVVQGAGITVHPLGLPRDVEGDKLIAVLYEISEASLARVRAVGGLSGTVLEHKMPIEDIVRRRA